MRFVPYGLLSVALFTSIWALFAAFGSRNMTVLEVSDPQLDNLRRSIDTLHERLNAFESEQNKQEQQSPQRQEQKNTNAVDHVALDELRERIASLENRSSGKDALHDGVNPETLNYTAAAMFKLREEAIEDYRNRILHDKGSVSDKIDALSTLRFFPPEYKARSGAVALHMMRVFESVDDPRVQARILRNIKGVQDANVIRFLIDILRNAEDSVVRQEAAESLGPVAMVDSEARVALQYGAENDADATVRAEARKALASK